MTIEVKNKKLLFQFLRNNTFPNIPIELFDRYMWLYDEIEIAQYGTVYGKNINTHRFYQYVVNDQLLAIAAVEIKDGCCFIKIDSNHSEDLFLFLKELVKIISSCNPTIILYRKELAAACSNYYRVPIDSARIKYYTNETPNLP